MRLIRANITSMEQDEDTGFIKFSGTGIDSEEINERTGAQSLGFYAVPKSDSALEGMVIQDQNTLYMISALDSPNNIPDSSGVEGSTVIYADKQNLIQINADIEDEEGFISITGKRKIVFRTIEETPTGVIEGKTTIDMRNDGTVTVYNGNGSIDLKADGTIELNGSNLTVDP